MKDKCKEKIDIHKLREKLEGPQLIRYGAMGAGKTMVLGSIVGLYDIFEEIKSPSTMFLKLLIGFCGITILAIELKGFGKTAVTDWFHRWFPFLTVMWGKGMFMIFAGSLGVAFLDSWTLLIPNFLCIAVGVIYVGMYLGKFQKFNAEFAEKAKLQSEMYISQYGELQPLIQNHVAPHHVAPPGYQLA